MSETKKKILVVDDEEDLRDMIGYQLKSSGYDVQTAKDGVDALEKLPAFDPDLIILDMNMPRMGGLEFYKTISGDDGKPSHKILVLTARANLQELFDDFDVEGFMPKPFEIPELLKQVNEILKKSDVASADKANLTRHSSYKVCVVDDDNERAKKICFALLKEGYNVSYSDTTAIGMEMIALNKPDIALFRLGLPKLQGDEAVLKLKRVSKTAAITYIVYKADVNFNPVVTGHIAEKDINFIEIFSQTDELMALVNSFVK